MSLFHSLVLLLLGCTLAQDIVKSTMLNLHNEKRSIHTVASLEWSHPMARKAKQWATFLHSTNSFFPDRSVPYGINMIRLPNASLRTMFMKWYNEKDNYNFFTGKPKSDGASYKAFTQIVWKGSVRLGCGLTGIILVCYYDPRGNIEGSFLTNVFRKHQ